jgi:alpha-beta hydrolase superfamily lysophospholipase
MQFTITSSEGLPIHGNLDAPSNPRALAIIVHGFKGYKDWGFFPWVAETLCNHHLAVCRFNMSRSGIGTNFDVFDRLDLFRDDTYSVQLADLHAVVRYCRARIDAPLFLLGHSRGGGVALLAAPDIEGLCGVATWNAIASVDRWDAATKAEWRRGGRLDIVNARTKQVMPMSTRILDDYEANRERLDILGAAARIDAPLLVVHGGRDESVPAGESEAIADRARDASRVRIATATHTFNAIHPLVNVPAELSLAAEVTAHFIGVYA